jgi:hypothetical protein
MSPRIESGELCTVEPVAPVDAGALRAGDVVLREVRSAEYFYLRTSAAPEVALPWPNGAGWATLPGPTGYRMRNPCWLRRTPRTSSPTPAPP